MSQVKDSVIAMVRSLPDDVTIEDIMERLYVEQKILKGQQQLREGKFHTHEEAKAILKKWLA